MIVTPQDIAMVERVVFFALAVGAALGGCFVWFFRYELERLACFIVGHVSVLGAPPVCHRCGLDLQEDIQ